MQKEFFIENRKELYKKYMDSTILVSYAGNEKHRTADANYIFFPNRNFAYLTGIGSHEAIGFIFVALIHAGKVDEYIFSLPSDLMAERWNGRRLTHQDISELSGVENILNISDFADFFHRNINRGIFTTVALDVYRHFTNQEKECAHTFAESVKANYPNIKIENYHFNLRKQRTIKKPCEIENMRKAIAITGEGIKAMMRASKPDMYEYEYKAEFDYQLTKNNVLEPGFSSIISAGNNNFSIHYYGYQGIAKDGDMILNDVGATYDGICSDISRAFPCNGKFSEKQKLLYSCAYKASEYMFSIIKPGMPMLDVDRLCREYCAEQLVKIGLLDDVKNASKYIWHGGAHHVGFDVHDQVVVDEIKANMIFCVDVGIYVEEWGIGFRLEDNCLVTEDGCENLSALIPRTIEEIETIMNG